MAHAGAGATQGPWQGRQGKQGQVDTKRLNGKTGLGAAVGRGRRADAASPGAPTDADKGRGPYGSGPVSGRQGLT